MGTKRNKQGAAFAKGYAVIEIVELIGLNKQLIAGLSEYFRCAVCPIQNSRLFH